MKKHVSSKSHKYLLWPILILLFLTIGVFLTTNQAEKEQDARTRAQVFQNPSLFPSGFADDVASPSPSPTKPVPQTSIKPVRATLSFSFSLPGISSQGGNMTPLRKTRDITLKFYEPDADSGNKHVLPQFSLNLTATFDEDPGSPTYTSFVNKEINLEKLCFETSQCVPRGKYQIAIKTQQTLQKVSKKKETDVGGKAYDINTSTKINVDFRNLIYGDIAPSPNGDNIIDRKDLLAFTSCFGGLLLSEGCVNKQAPDFDDNGFVDGYDYNLLLASFEAIEAQGGTAPEFNQAEKIEIKERIPTPSPSAVIVKNQQQNSLGTVFGLLIFFLLIAASVFFVLKNKKIKSLIKTPAKKSGFEEKEYFVKKQKDDPDGKSVWLTIADDEGQKLGRYLGKDVKDGFAHIKGARKIENGKEFIEISKIIWEEKA